MRQKEGGRAQPFKEVGGGDDTVIEKKRIWQKVEPQRGPRWQKSLLPVDLKPHYTLTLPHHLNDTPTGTMIVHRITIKGQKAGRGPILRNPAPSLKRIFLPSIPPILLHWMLFDCVDHNKLWKSLQETGIPDHLTCLLRNLYVSQETTVRTGHGTTDWF